MPKSLAAIVFFIFISATHCFAQDTLPNILVKNYSGRIVISWKNNYGAHISTMNIQRSIDSTKNFATFATVLNPMNKQNGIVDSKPPAPNMFYRIFIVFDGGNYVFTASHKPDTVIAPVETKSSLKPLPDTLYPKAPIRTGTTPNAPPAIALGRYIFTGKDNNVIITLPDVATHKYSIKFFDDKNNFVFEVKKITESYLILDKVNFMHSGTFNYELYDKDNLLEKYRVIIPKDRY